MTDATSQLTPKKSNPWLWVALSITFGLVLWTSQRENAANEITDISIVKVSPSQQTRADPINAQEKKSPSETLNVTSSVIDWDKLNRKINISGVDKSKELFNVHSWVIAPPPPKVVKTPPPPPKAPPVPFTYMGRLDNSPKGNLIYLATTDNSYSVVLGHQVDSFWHLDREDAENLYFTYLPLNLPQVLEKNQRAAAPEPTQAVVNAFQ